MPIKPQSTLALRSPKIAERNRHMRPKPDGEKVSEWICKQDVIAAENGMRRLLAEKALYESSILAC